MIRIQIILVVMIALIHACAAPSSDPVSTDFKIPTDTTLPQSPVLRDMILELEKTSLTELHDVEHIPQFIRSYLDSLTDGFTIANKNEDWAMGCTDYSGMTTITKTLDASGDTICVYDTTKMLAARQLVCFSLGEKIAVMSYKTGGFGVMQHVVIFRFENSEVTSFWHQGVEFGLSNTIEIVSFLRNNENRIWSLSSGNSIM